MKVCICDAGAARWHRRVQRSCDAGRRRSSGAVRSGAWRRARSEPCHDAHVGAGPLQLHGAIATDCARVQRYLIICLEAQSIPVAVKAMRPPIGMDTEADARSVVATPAALGTALR